MTRLLSRYLSVTILRYYAALATVAVVVASLIEFLENRDGLMDEPNLTVLDAIRFSLLSAPGIFTLLAGFIALVAVLVACIALLRHSELKVMLAAGLTYGQLLLAVLPAALLMGGIHFGVENLVLPRTTSALHAWGTPTPAAIARRSRRRKNRTSSKSCTRRQAARVSARQGHARP